MFTKIKSLFIFFSLILSSEESQNFSDNIISRFSSNEWNCSSVMANERLNTDLPKPVLIDGRFDNPWPTWKKPSLWSVMKFALGTDRSNIPKADELDKTLPIVEPSFDFNPDQLSFTWIGHSTTVVHLNGITILTDPIFSERASLSQLVGPSRYRRAAVTVDQLPPIDAVVISHNHYDHLDLKSVEDLNKRFGNQIHWFVPLKMSEWMRDVGCSNVVELDWWQESCIPQLPDIKFILTPTQHWSKRSVFDDNKVLWGSWAVVGPKHKFYFGGDTGYCSAFKQIGQMYGPFDLAAIPIGAYEPRWFMTPQHVDPEQAVQIHRDIKSKFSVGIHWGTFALAHEYYLEPPLKLKDALKQQKLDEKEFICISHGMTVKS